MFSPNLIYTDESAIERMRKRRNRMAVWSGVSALGILIGAKFLPPSIAAPVQSHLLVSQHAVSVAPVSVGGDVTPDPPPPPAPKLPERLGEPPFPNAFTAKSIIVKDTETGAVLYGKDEYAERPIASITKFMSALVILERQPEWSATTTVPDDGVPDTHMYAGDTYTMRDLWNAALVGSSNKAIMALADAVGWPRDAFVERMKEKALELGMTSARFTEPTGLDPGNAASASDVAVLVAEAMKSEDILQAVVQKEFSLYSKERKKTHHMWNTDWLLLGWIPQDFPDFRGGKTGYIPASGYNFAMQAGDRARLLTVVVLGAETHEARFTEARDIAAWALANYRWPE